MFVSLNLFVCWWYWLFRRTLLYFYRFKKPFFYTFEMFNFIKVLGFRLKTVVVY